jgi:hypothetical protein
MSLPPGSTAAIAQPSRAWQTGLLRSQEFDGLLIVVSAAWALIAGASAVHNPDLFLPILFLDVWLLGYQHIVATFTRLVFDTDSLSRHRTLVTTVPVLVAAATLGTMWLVGPWVVATTYLYWQWFHYTRQSYGVSRMYLRKANAVPNGHDPIAFGVLYLLPLWGILRRSAQHPETFLNLSLKTPPIPDVLLYIVAAAALICIALWIPRELAAVRKDARRAPHACYVATHIAIFTTGYLLIDDINVGWLVLNIWHNVQYLLVVWMFNANRFKSGVDPTHRFLSTISQPQRVFAYVAISLAAATALYIGIQTGIGLSATNILPVSFAVYMIINFHHYVVDGIIWRRRHAATVAAAG